MSLDPTWKPVVDQTVRFVEIEDMNTICGSDIRCGTIRPPVPAGVGASTVLPFMFTQAMMHLCGTTAVVKEVSPRTDALGYYNVLLHKHTTSGETERFLYSSWMLCDAAETSMTIDGMLAEIGVSIRAYNSLVVPENATPEQIDEIVKAKETIMKGLSKIERGIDLRYSHDKCTKREVYRVLKALFGSNAMKLRASFDAINESKAKYTAETMKHVNRRTKALMIAKFVLKQYANIYAEKYPTLMFNRLKFTTVVPGGDSKNVHIDKIYTEISNKVLELVKFDNSSRIKGGQILGRPVNTAPHDRWNAAANHVVSVLGMSKTSEGEKIYRTSVDFFEVPKLVFACLRTNGSNPFISVRHPSNGDEVRALSSAVTQVNGSVGPVFRDLVSACATCGTQHGRGSGQPCQRCYDNANRNIFAGYHSTNRPYDTPRVGAVRFGIENELHCKDAKDNHAAFGIIRQNSDLAIGELDGSLGQYDGEVILRPMPFTNQAMKHVTDFFQTLSAHMIVPDQNNSTTSYGLHINVSGYNTETSVRASNFLKKHQQLVETLAGRAQNSYCNYSNINAGTKYSAINIRRNGVAEFRIFRATVDRDTLLMRIQFAIGLLEFCDVVTDMNAANFNWEGFKTFAKGMRRSNELRCYLHPELKKVARRVPVKAVSGVEFAPGMQAGAEAHVA